MNTKLIFALVVMALLVSACSVSQEQEINLGGDNTANEDAAQETGSDVEATNELEAGYIEEDSDVDIGELY